MFWTVTPCNPVVFGRLEGLSLSIFGLVETSKQPSKQTTILFLLRASSSILKKEAIRPSETVKNIYQTTCLIFPEDSIVHKHRRLNFNCHKYNLLRIIVLTYKHCKCNTSNHIRYFTAW